MGTSLKKEFLSGLFYMLLGSMSGPMLSQTQWVKQFGGTDADIGSCTAVDLSGNLYTTGTFTGTSNFGTYNLSSNGKGDAFIMKASASTGDVVWVKQIGASNEDNGNSVTCDASGNIFATGRFSGTLILGSFTLIASGTYDSYLVRLDPSTGAYIWAKRLGGSGSDGGLAITNDGAGSIYSCGYFQGTATFGTSTLTPSGSNLNMYVLRTDANSGNTVWAKGFGNTGYTYATALACDLVGDIYVTGHYEAQLVMGTNTLSSVQYEDVFVSKHDAVTGNVVWANSMGGAGTDNGNGIAVNSLGEAYCVGKFETTAAFGTTTLTSAGNSDIFISKLDGLSGNVMTVKQLGAGGYEQASAVALDASGKVYFTGQFNGIVNFDAFNLSSSGNADAFIAKLDPISNAITWASAMGGQTVDSGYGIALDGNGFLYCTGVFQSSVDILGNQLTAKGSSDVFVLKLLGLTVNLENTTEVSPELSLAPNPCKDELNIRSGIENECTITITDRMGTTLKTLRVNSPQLVLDLSDWNTGIYFVTLVQENQRLIVKKLIKE